MNYDKATINVEKCWLLEVVWKAENILFLQIGLAQLAQVSLSIKMFTYSKYTLHPHPKYTLTL